MISWVSWRIPMRRALACVLLCMASALLLVGCTPPWQHNNVVAASNFGAKPTAQQVLTTLQKNFRSVTAFHVVMKAENLGAPSDSSQIQIRTAEGDVLMPDKVKAQANVLLSGQALTINLVSIGETQYITDPITGQWRVVKGVLNASALTNPDTGIISLAGKLQKVSGPYDDSINGTPCWRVDGLLDARYIAFFTGGGVPAGTMLQTSVCSGKADALPYVLKVVGQATRSDTPQTTRTFVISNYNENISITAPHI